MKLSTMMKRLKMRPLACLALALGCSLSLSSCGGDKDKDKDTSDTGGGGDPPVEENGTGGDVVTPPVPVAGTTQSPHFAAVAKHLDLGGTVFGYVDIDGDVEKLADMAQRFLDLAKNEGADMPPHIKMLDLGEVMGELGLDGIEAIGMSSYLDGELYHNKAYAHIPAGRKGLLKVVGGDAKAFLAKSLAPKDSDLILEQSLDARAGFDVVKSMVAKFGGPEATQSFNDGVGEVLPQLGLSIADLFRKLDTRLTVIGRIHPDKPLELPDAPADIPSFDLLIALDDMGWLYEKVTGEMKKEIPADQQAQMFIKGDGFERIPMPPMPDPEMAIVQPMIHHDIAGKRVLIASSAAFLEECLGGASKITDSPEFAKATRGLPAEGNGLSYVTAQFLEEYKKLYKTIGTGTPSVEPGGATPAQAAIMSDVIDGFFPDAVASASVTVNTPEGILLASNASQSFKESVVMSGLGGVAVAAAIAFPAFNHAKERAYEAREEAELQRREIERELERLEQGGAVPIPPDEDAVPTPADE